MKTQAHRGGAQAKGAWPAQAMNILFRIKQKATETTHVIMVQGRNQAARGEHHKPYKDNSFENISRQQQNNQNT